jgi:hypothetical protein
VIRQLRAGELIRFTLVMDEMFQAREHRLFSVVLGLVTPTSATRVKLPGLITAGQQRPLAPLPPVLPSLRSYSDPAERRDGNLLLFREFRVRLPRNPGWRASSGAQRSCNLTSMDRRMPSI